MRFVLTLVSFAATALAAGRTSPPSGAIVVNSNPASGQYSTISAAVAKLSTSTTSAQTIFIYSGTYKEQVYIPALKGPLTVYGYTTDTSHYSSNTVTISAKNCLTCGATNDDLTATVRNYAANSKFYNINMANTYGKGSQALALSAYAGQQGYYACQFTGYQDTILAETGTQVYAKSLITGATDFVFGQHSPAWFDGCDIKPVAGGTISASGRASISDANYYVFNKCAISAYSSSVPAGSVYLGRPWSQYARVVFQLTSMSNIINSAGWEQWSSSSPNTGNVYYGEYGNTGAGASGTRASFSKKLSSPVAITAILGSTYNSWVDTSYLS